MKKLLAGLISTTAVVLVSGCAGSEPCIINVSGNKLCGGDAAAWCRVTDSFRNPLSHSQQVCDNVESKY